MALNGFQEGIFFHYILDDAQFLSTTKKDFFSNQIIGTTFDIAKEHALKYKEAPSKDQINDLIRIKGLETQITADILSALYNSKIQLKEYDDQWLTENIGAWIQVRNAELAFRKGAAYLKTSKVTAENASEIVEKLKHMMTSDMSIDFSFQMGSDFFDPKSHLQTRLDRKTSGYPYIDKCLKGGFWKGSLVCFLAGPKAGKSLWLQNLTAKSVLNGNNSMYVTCELQEELVHMRMGANMLSINIDTYEEQVRDQDFLRKKLNNLKSESFVPPGRLSVKEFPSGAASVNDIRAHILKEQEILGIHFDNVFVDYINLIKNWRNPNSENLYIKIKQVAEDLRAMAMEEGWSVITVTQTNRSGWENENMSIQNVSESAALIMTVDALFGIITSPEMKARGEYMLKYMADRVSGMENTRKKFGVDFKLARIEEDTQSTIEDLDVLIGHTVGGNNADRGAPKANDIVAQTSAAEIPELNSLFP
jgi:KaiC/GvpD/RAD55 family RecA-like ATPase